MIELLSHWLIRNRENTGDPAVRRAYGRLCGLVGIGLNLLLFGGKLFAGTVSGSVAVTACQPMELVVLQLHWLDKVLVQSEKIWRNALRI